MISSGQWTYVLIKMLINNNSHKEIQIIQELTALILCNLSFLLFQTIQYAQFFLPKILENPYKFVLSSTLCGDRTLHNSSFLLSYRKFLSEPHIAYYVNNK